MPEQAQDTFLSATVRNKGLREFFEATAAINHEVRLDVDEEGLRAYGRDPPNVCYVEATLSAEVFTTWEREGDLSIGLHPENYLRFLERFPDDLNVGLAITEEAGTITLEFNEFRHSRNYRDPDEIRAVELDQFDLPGRFELPGDRLRESVEFLDAMAGERISVGPYSGGVALSSSSALHESVVRLPRTELSDTTTPDGVRSSFSSEYLTDLVGHLDDNRLVEISFGDDEPLQFEHVIADGGGTVVLSLACRIVHGGDDQ